MHSEGAILILTSIAASFPMHLRFLVAPSSIDLALVALDHLLHSEGAMLTLASIAASFFMHLRFPRFLAVAPSSLDWWRLLEPFVPSLFLPGQRLGFFFFWQEQRAVGSSFSTNGL